jgi:hypothetical protein
MADTIRVLIGLLGGLLMIGGLIGVAGGAWTNGLWAAITGAIALVAVVLERARYRSEATERSKGASGPGGGEPERPAAPFQPTDELFVDPTSGQRLRVYLNPATGERRYYAEGTSRGG